MAVRDDEAAARADRARAIGLFRYQLIRGGRRPWAVVEGPGPAGPGDRRSRAHQPGGAAGSGLPLPTSTAGSGRGVAAGSTPWCPTRASRPRGFRWSCWRWRSRSSGRTPSGPPRRSAGSCAPRWAGRPESGPCNATSLSSTATDPDRHRGGRGRGGVRAVGSRPAQRVVDRDALHGPHIGGRKTYLFAFLDDHSRAIMGHRFGFAEDTVRLAAALRPALGSRRGPRRGLRRQLVGVRRTPGCCGRARNWASN